MEHINERMTEMENWNIFKMRKLSVLLCLVALFILVLLIPLSSYAADDSVCARVKIEIQQELTLERQAFDAHMRINNGLSNITLENVDIDVSFSDENGNIVRASFDPNDTTALFFIKVNSMDNITNIEGSGTVQPSSFADIHWMIIPAPGASNGLSQGKLYYVGATLKYAIGGQEHVTTVTPDYIFVKPMPELTLDYFLPSDVYGDDAFTPAIEAPVPFSLGVRVKNSGTGVAKNLKIDSAQPKIVENEQGLLIGFLITGSEVNGQAATNSLLADFGDIQPNTSGTARWIMTCSLSGQFVEFTAEFSHSDELGGELTSLIDAVNTHFLVHDVLVDLPGRDSVRDFLARDSGVYRIYESNNLDTEVTDQSALSSLQIQSQAGSEISYTISSPATAGFMYVQLHDPYNGQKVLKEMVRSDGKRIKTENSWLSKVRKEDHSWEYFINLFDVNSPGSYTTVFSEPEGGNHAPVLQYIPDRNGREGQQLSFVVEASDQDGTIPKLVASPLPVHAKFTDLGNGTGIFDWTPTQGQAGKFEINFIASDGILNDTKHPVLTILGESENNPPYIPSSPSPSDGATGIDKDVMLGWQGGDPDQGDIVTYDAYLGTNNPPVTKVSSDQSGNSYQTSGLTDGTQYYWKIVARDSHNAETEGPVWKFTTYQSSIDIQLQTGFNLISAPVDVPDAYTFLGLIDSSGTKVDRIMRYDSSSGTVEEAYYDENGNKGGDNFLMVPGEGLIIYVKEDMDIGLTQSSCPIIDLNVGMNWIGIPCQPNSATAFILLQSIGDETVVSSIQRFNTVMGMFETAGYRDGIPTGINFPMNAGEGCFIYMKQGKTRFRP